MTADVRRSALAPFAAPLAAAGVREVALGSQVSVRVDPQGAGASLGLPTDPNTWSRVASRDALWLGPDEWLVASSVEPAGDVIADLESRLAGRHHSVVDVSANRVVLELARADRLEVLAAGCGLDLHPRAWRPGMCAQTLLANVAVLLQEDEAATRVFVRPSFAGHLVAWLDRVSS